jgi:hypothetical protein
MKGLFKLEDQLQSIKQGYKNQGFQHQAHVQSMRDVGRFMVKVKHESEIKDSIGFELGRKA